MTPTDTASPSERDQMQLTCLLASLGEVQQTIRSYDTKAQIMGVGFIFSVSMISRFLANLQVDHDYGIGYLVVGFLLLIGPVALYGAVIFPSRRSAPKLIDTPVPIQGLFYVKSEGVSDLDTFNQKLKDADWTSELTYEIVRLSALRDMKRKRFLIAMFASGGSFALIFLGEFLKIAGVA